MHSSYLTGAAACAGFGLLQAYRHIGSTDVVAGALPSYVNMCKAVIAIPAPLPCPTNRS